MPLISKEQRERIVHYKEQGLSYRQIKEKFTDDGRDISISGIRRFWKKFRDTQSISDRPRGRRQRQDYNKQLLTGLSIY